MNQRSRKRLHLVDQITIFNPGASSMESLPKAMPRGADEVYLLLQRGILLWMQNHCQVLDGQHHTIASESIRLTV